MLANASNIKQQTQDPLLTRLTEVIIPKDRNTKNIVLPLVASHSNLDKNQWLTWITYQQPEQQELVRFGASINTLRIIHQPAGTDTRWIIWEALQAGNSHTVVADCSGLSVADLKELEKAANLGRTDGILIRNIAS